MLPAALAASWLVSTWDQNASLRVMSPAGAAFEDVALGWVLDVLGLAAGERRAPIVTGATMANFCGLAAARHALLEHAGWNVESDGLFGAPPLRVVVGEEVHISLLKALGLLGLGRQRVERVKVDGQGRMRGDALPDVDDRTIVCVQAGNVNTGAFDPAGEICRRAHERGAWVHVDGAFGLWAAASPQYQHLTDGFSDADSWATDGHKWPNVGYDCGIALVRDADALRAAMAMTSAYFAPGERREPSQFSPEMSRRARGVELWAALRSLGRQGLADLIERTCSHARRFADGLRERGYEILNDVVINQVLVSFGTPESNTRDRRQDSGRRRAVVRHDRVAGPHGHAHQRLVVGDDRGRCPAEPGRDRSRRPNDRLTSGYTHAVRTLSLVVLCCLSTAVLFAESAAGLHWTAPAGWKAGPPQMMRAATYAVAAGARRHGRRRMRRVFLRRRPGRQRRGEHRTLEGSIHERREAGVGHRLQTSRSRHRDDDD